MRRIAAFALALLCVMSPAEARVIALLFDDSGSMSGRIQLPAFGAQLLVSTLDGRQGEDRLIAARMSQVGKPAEIERIDIRTTRLQQDAIDTIATRWPVAEGGTPFQQIELLLREVEAAQQPGEEAYFVILTDGQFNQGGTSGNPLPPPPADAMRRLFETYKSQAKGPLRADFVLVGADDGEVADAVEQQGIRAALLETFNGNPSDGRYDISNSADLVETIKDIVARVAATDRQGQSRFTAVHGNAIAIDSPLSVKRIVAVSTGRSGSPVPKAAAPAFPVAERIDLQSLMKHPDRRGAWAEDTIAGLATHFLLHPALPPGHYEVPFDSAPDGVFLLFQTDAGLRLALRDRDGRPIEAKNGVYQVPRGADATVALEIVDRAGDQIAVVPASQLGGRAGFAASLDMAGQRRSLEVRTAAQEPSAAAALPTDVAGRGRVEASLRVEGFVSTYARPLDVEVVDIAGSVAAKLEAVEPCATCGPGELRYTISAREPRRPVAKVVVDAQAPLAGMLAMTLEGSPPWLSLAYASAAQPFAEVAVRAGEPAHIEAYLIAAPDVAAVAGQPAGGFPLSVRAELTGGPQGSATASATIRLLLGEASLRLTGHTQDPTGAALLNVDLPALQEGSEALDLLLVDALAGADAGNVSVASDTWFVDFLPKASGDRIAVQPRIAWWCACFAVFDRGAHEVRITWTGPDALQSAVASAPVIVRTPWRQLVWPCATLLVLLLLVVYAGWCVSAGFRARRFPRRSGVSIYFGPREDRRYRHLRRANWTYLKALIAPFAGIPHEVRTVEGLTLRAASSGADILIDKSDGNFRIETLNRTIEECRAENAKMLTYKLNWNDTVERRDSGLRRLTLLKKPEDLAS